MHPLVFLVGCIGTRLFAAYLAFFLIRKPPVLLKIFGALLLVPAIGFTLIYANGWRKTGPETSGKPIWWNAHRPLHATVYFVAAICAFFKRTRSLVWMFLLADALFGLLVYIVHNAGEAASR